MDEDDRWKAWWKGEGRPFLVLNPAQFCNEALRAEIDAKYPGVEVRQAAPLPLH